MDFKKVKDNICTFEINGYIFHIKEKISTNPKNFLIWIKGKNAHYSFEGQGKNVKKDFKLSQDELNNIQNVL